MGSRKDEQTKEQLSSYTKSNKRVPLWVMVKTNRKVTTNPKQKNWRISDKGKKIRKKQKLSKGEI
ncbi:MAG: 50S ribosomal protein L39e [Candidatus Diapherotrites archaeon]|nr:50S ribosomal protein L39e [Candidatus Diapherotrites archaeon]